MDFNLTQLLQGAGVVLCIGGLLIGAVLFIAMRSLFNNRREVNRPDPYTPNQAGYSQTSSSQAGTERPRYDDARVTSRGGFGRPTGQRTGLGQAGRGQVSRSREQSNSTDMLPNTGDEDRLQAYRRQHNQRPDRDDIDDVTSQGGFGG